MIKYIAILALCSCAPVSRSIQSNCGLSFGGTLDGSKSYVTLKDTNDMINAAIDAASFTTDYRLIDSTELCESIVGYVLYVNPNPSWDSFGSKVAGTTVCKNRVITINTPISKNWKDSSAVHEFFHVFQNCIGLSPPTDYAQDEYHSNWARDGIYKAIERSRK